MIVQKIYFLLFKLLILNLPLPPSVNTYWRANGKRRFISKEGMLFRENVIDYCIDNKVPSFGDKRLQFQVTLYPRDKRIQDIDNRIKALFDALEGWAYDSDSQIDVLIVQRGEIRKGGGCLVMIDELDATRQ
jgi:crossover junction endodeoxyribonuclease RusA